MSEGAYFAALAAREADAVVLRGASGDWGAAAVLTEVAELAALLAGCRVLAVLADNAPEWVIADLAALRAGCVHLPLPTFFSQAQLAHALEQTGADALLTDQAARIDALALGYTCAASWHGLAWMRRACPAAALPAGTAKVSFTSGSTGSPKGVCLSADGLRRTAAALVATLADLSITRHLAVLPLALLLENVAGVYAPLLRGAEIILPGLAQLGWRGMAGFDAAALCRALETTRPHSLILVPELLKAWLLVADQHAQPDSSRFVAVGGARCDATLIEAARGRGLPVYEGYGLTECGSVVSLNRPGADQAGTVGRPLSHARVRVDAVREVHIATACFLGYLGDDGGTATQVFSSGDLGYLDPAGYLRLSGRRKSLLITAYGRNVSPEWVEASLVAQPEIAQALVLGDARPWLVALLVVMPDMDETALAVAVARANGGLPDYARVGDWLVVAPFTSANGQATGNGRFIREAIAAAYADAITSLYR